MISSAHRHPFFDTTGVTGRTSDGPVFTFRACSRSPVEWPPSRAAPFRAFESLLIPPLGTGKHCSDPARSAYVLGPAPATPTHVTLNPSYGCLDTTANLLITYGDSVEDQLDGCVTGARSRRSPTLRDHAAPADRGAHTVVLPGEGRPRDGTTVNPITQGTAPRCGLALVLHRRPEVPRRVWLRRSACAAVTRLSMGVSQVVPPLRHCGFCPGPAGWTVLPPGGALRDAPGPLPRARLVRRPLPEGHAAAGIFAQRLLPPKFSSATVVRLLRRQGALLRSGTGCDRREPGAGSRCTSGPSIPGPPAGPEDGD